MITERSKVAFALTMLASACLNNVFVSYYVEMFTEIAHMNTTWFMSTQVVFCLWNCSNDLLFGWLSDRSSCWGYLPDSSNPLKRRLFAIGIGGPLWVVAFLFVFWWPFDPHTASAAQSGLWAMFALLFYDGMLTYVEVNHSALLADMTSNSDERAQANMYSAICAAIGSLSSFFAHMFWTPANLQSFRYFCAIIGGVAIVCFSFTVTNLDRNMGKHTAEKATDAKVRPVNRQANNNNNNNNNNETSGNTTSSDKVVPAVPKDLESTLNLASPSNVDSASFVVGLKKFLIQLSAHRNFKFFCVLNLLQVFDCTFEKNFLGSFLRHFSGNALSTESQSVVVSLSFVLPWCCTVFITPIVQRSGLHQTLKRIFLFRILVSIAGVCIGLFGHTHWLFLLINRVSSECVCRLIPLIIAQLSDEDIYLHQRDASSGSLRASVFGAANVVGKIGQSAAPMFGYFLLLQHVQKGDSAVMVTDSVTVPVLVAAVPLLVVVLQFAVWNRYNLHGTYLNKVSAFVHEVNENRNKYV